MSKVDKEWDKWYPDGLFYEKRSMTFDYNLIVIERSRIFCVTFWILRTVYPERYISGK